MWKWKLLFLGDVDVPGLPLDTAAAPSTLKHNKPDVAVTAAVSRKKKQRRVQRGELTEDEEDAQCEEHHSKPQTSDAQSLVICRGRWTQTDGRGRREAREASAAVTLNSTWVNLVKVNSP